MNDLTRILSAIEEGDGHACVELTPLVYDALRRLASHKLARAAPGQPSSHDPARRQRVGDHGERAGDSGPGGARWSRHTPC